jgi:hypothetical protein
VEAGAKATLLRQGAQAVLVAALVLLTVLLAQERRGRVIAAVSL